jgi:hypothetical protein
MFLLTEALEHQSLPEALGLAQAAEAFVTGADEGPQLWPSCARTLEHWTKIPRTVMTVTEDGFPDELMRAHVEGPSPETLQGMATTGQAFQCLARHPQR